MNVILRLVTKQFEKGIISKEGVGTVAPETPEDLEIVLDIPYHNHSHIPLTMDLYRSKQGSVEPMPVIIVVHGGGLLVGNKEMTRPICQGLARSGYLVMSPQYRLLSETDGFGAIADLCAGLRMAEQIAPQYGGDPERIYVIGESAGAYLSVYACAMATSATLCNTFGFTSAANSIKGLACLSGMFYTARKDIIGRVYAKDLYGTHRKDSALMQYMNPEHKEVMEHLPPIIMTTSDADFLKGYTLEYAEALTKAGNDALLLDYGKGKHLIHAFPALNPYLSESIDAMSRILQWFASK